jgi:hypothetical protein
LASDQRADDHVVIAVIVEVARTGDGPPKIVRPRRTFNGKTVGTIKTGKFELGSESTGFAEDDLGFANQRVSIERGIGCTNNHIVDAIPIDISRTRDGKNRPVSGIDAIKFEAVGPIDEIISVATINVIPSGAADQMIVAPGPAPPCHSCASRNWKALG